LYFVIKKFFRRKEINNITTVPNIIHAGGDGIAFAPLAFAPLACALWLLHYGMVRQK
jgi:hypothetical protein